jgi:hypothetical protein
MCRQCGLRLDGATFSDLPAPDDAGANVKRGIDLLDWVFFGLIGLGVLAIVFLSLQPKGGYEGSISLMIGFALAFAYLDVAVLLALGRRMLRWWRSWKQRQSEAGAVALLLVVLIPGMIFGVVAVLFVTCWGILLSKGIS